MFVHTLGMEIRESIVSKASGGSEERTVIDALRDLLEGKYGETRGLSWAITRLTDPNARHLNGIQCCFTEVTFSDGSQYGMEAFGDEAAKLYKKSLQYQRTGAEHSVPVLLVA